MEKMEELFIPYEQALKLKELGFEEKTVGYFRKKGVFNFFDKRHLNSSNQIVLGNDEYVLAPLWQQAFDFLYAKSGKYLIPIPCDGYWNDNKKWHAVGKQYETYEEARLVCTNEMIDKSFEKLK